MNSPNQTLFSNQQEQQCKNDNTKMAAQYGKTDFTEKPGKNVANTSKYKSSSNLFKTTSWFCNMLKPNSKFETECFFTD